MENYYTEVQLPFHLPTPIYGAMLAAWQLRPDLQLKFPLQDMLIKDYLKFLGWCVSHGRQEYAAFVELTQWNRALENQVKLPPLAGDPYGPLYSAGIYLAGIARQHDFLWPLLCSRRARRRIWHWYWREGRSKLKLCTANWQLQAMAKTFDYSIEAFISELLPPQTDRIINQKLIQDYGLDDVYSHFQVKEQLEAGPNFPDEMKSSPFLSNLMPDSKNEYGRKCTIDSPTIWHRLLGKLYDRYPIFHFRYARLIADYFVFSSRSNPDDLISSDTKFCFKKRRQPLAPYGVNLIGFAHGELGIGEDLRMLAQTFNKGDIPFCVLNIQPGSNVSTEDMSVDEWLSDQPIYAINIFCMTAKEHINLFLKKGKKILEGRYNIGLWPWELAEWPNKWSHAYTLVDEIWGISEFTSQAYATAPIPVITMPSPVLVEPISNLKRRNFKLPANDYLFICSFDLNSTIARKNPHAVVDAFRFAFSGTENVGLVLKVSNSDEEHEGWQQLRKRCVDDNKIYIIDSTLRRPDLLALYRCCNCFVSLHRSEGFGRNIVESLMLGLDVIATGYSGNVDYAHAENLHLVEYTLKEVRQGEYFGAEGLSWAEPSTEQAAAIMQQLVKDQNDGSKREFHFNDYHPEMVSHRYQERLSLIFNNY